MAMSSALRRVVTSIKSAVGISTPAAFPIFGIAPTLTGQNVTAERSMRVPAVACAVSLIAETAGHLPFKLFDRETREAVKDHPTYRLIHDEANPWTSAEELREQLTADALLHGHGFALVIRNGIGEPLELHRLEPGCVQLETDRDTGEPLYRVQLEGGQQFFPFTDILHVSAFRGVSPVAQAREAIGLALAFESHVAKLFANGGRPAGILSTEKKLGDEAKTKLSTAWSAAHGSGKSGGTAVLDEGMSFRQVTMTLTDAQFAENRLEQIREIARAFRVPPTMLFELTRGTWSNTEEMARQFLAITLKPWLSSWAWAYARVLLTAEERRDLYVEAVTDDLTTTDTAKRATAFGQYRSAGVMTANEVRAAMNLPPHPEGEVLDSPYTKPATGPTTEPANNDETPK